VLVLLVDTLRADRLGVYGATPSPSPTLDRFAARGTVFEVAVAQASWTMPSVASIFTGLHPRTHGAVGIDTRAPAGLSGAGTLLPDAVTTMAEVAQEAGLSTVGISTNLLIDRATNLAQGFETFVLLPYDDESQRYVSARVVNDRFRDWLRRARGLRFFAYLHYMEPHGPYIPRQDQRVPPPDGMDPDLARGWVRDVALAVNRGRGMPPSPSEIGHLLELYDGEIRTWDEAFGELLRELEGADLLDDTIVVIAADHGEEFLEHGKLTHGEQLYEETIRVPLIVVGPGIPAERRSDLAQHIDLLPTIAALMGASPPSDLPGRDLFATRHASDAVSEIVAGFGDTGAGRGTIALRAGDAKLIRTPETSELYDLARDPREQANLGAEAAATSELAGRLERWGATVRPSPRQGAPDPELKDRLRQLGYVE
jgi:arylsulfatase A-like enzyme